MLDQVEYTDGRLERQRRCPLSIQSLKLGGWNVFRSANDAINPYRKTQEEMTLKGPWGKFKATPPNRGL
jgi:hypothetical protein